MLLDFLILVLTCILSSDAWKLKDTELSFRFLETWDITRPKRHDDFTIKDVFPVHASVSCGELHMTDEAPFTAILLYRESGRLLCMGSIIDNHHILSAKKCVEKTDFNDILVLVGYYKAYWGKHAQVKKVKQIIRHEYEVIILRLRQPIRFTDHIQATRLPSALTKKVDDFDKAFEPPYKIVGFMIDRFDVPGDYIDKEKIYMLKEDQFVKMEDCKGNYSRFYLEESKIFCTFGNATFCWGALGGPILKWKHNSYFVQVGIVIADSCTSNSTGPYLAARTDVYTDWIRGNSYHGHQRS